jgi:hypothetical protein
LGLVAGICATAFAWQSSAGNPPSVVDGPQLASTSPAPEEKPDLSVQPSPPAVEVAAADVQPQAALVFAQEQAARYQYLEQTGYGTVQNSQQYTSQLHQQQAAVLSAQATLRLAQRQVRGAEGATQKR